MKRYLTILALCGSVAAQDYTLDPYAAPYYAEQRRQLQTRIEQTTDQIDYHRRRALYLRGVAIELHDVYMRKPLSEITETETSEIREIDRQISYHERKARWFEELKSELYDEDRKVVLRAYEHPNGGDK